MKKKVFSLIMALVLAFMGVARAENLTVNDGTATDQYIPLFGWYADSYFKTESVYPSDMLATMAGGDITSVKFYASQTNVDWGNARFRVFLDEVNGTVPTGFSGPGTIVYEGALSIVGNEMTVTFTTPYHYNGGNLLLGVYCYVKGSYVQSTWFGTVVSGAALYGYSYSDLSEVTSATQRNFLPKTTFTYTGGGGTPGGGGSDPEIGLHVRYDNGEEGRELVIDDLYLGEYPAGAWMEPFSFQMYNDDTQALTVSVLDFTPNTDALSMATGTELPFTVAGNSAEYIDLAIQVQAPADAEAGDYEYQFVAIYEGSRLAKIWPLSFTIYTPEIPDVVEKAYDLGTIGDGYTYTGVPSDITPTVLHNDYTLPFPEIPEGNDAVYKFTVEGDMIISAYVDEANADGKVALYTEDFNGEGGPMAHNNYNGLPLRGRYVDEPTAETCGSHSNLPLRSNRAPWDLMHSFSCSSGYQYGVATDGNFIYTSSWSANSSSQFYKYDLSGNLVDEFNVAGSGQIRDLTYDGQYFYGVANGSTVYCLDLANQTLISSFTSAYGTQRGITYDPVRDGFWVIGNWSGNLTLINRSGAVQFTGPTPTSASGLAYYKDEANVEHVYCFNNENNQVYDYNIAANAIDPISLFDFSATPGYDFGSSGGCHIGEYDGKVCFFGDLQQVPNLVGIYELRDAPTPGPTPSANVSAGPVIEALPIQAGTYYLVASSTDADYTVYINAADMPCPAIDAEGFAFAQYPADDQDSIQPASVTLSWTNPEYATGWRLVFGSTYYPEAGHPQTILFPEDGSFSTEMANSYTVTNLWNNTNYFWHVEFNNGACADGVSSPIWGFTTTFNAPQNLVATPDQLIEGETTTLTWNAIVDRTYRTYRVYKDGVMIHETQPTPNPNVEANLSWTVPASELTYNMTGYTFNVTAVYDEGESPFSNDAVVKVTGYSAEPGIYGYVYEQDSVTPIGGVTVTVTGTDEFGNAVNYSATTNADGYYTMHPVLAGEYATALATCAGYQDAEPYTKVPPFTMPYQGTWGEMNFIMHEGFYPSPLVCAETVQVGDDELVKVWWQIPNGTGSGTGGGGGTGTGNLPITQGFEDGLGDWTIVNGATGSMFSTGVTTQFTPHSGNALFMFYFTTNPPQYLISPMLTGTENGVDVSFYHSARSANWQETFQVGYSTTTNDVDAFVFGPEITSNPIAYEEYTNSFPAGTKYVAVKCTSYDAFGLWIDDISISASGRGTTADRALHHYRIYRTNCYYDGPYYEGDPGGTVVLASAWVPDTAYFDVSWPDAAPGVYKWGVGVVYEGNQADNPNNPRGESQINWAAPMNNMDIASAEVTPYASNEPVMAGRAMWDLLGSFEAAEEAHYGVATDGTNLYTSNWGYSGATHNFYKYDMQGNMIEGFEIAGCGTLRGMTYDGQYFYGVANSSTVYCVDLANHTLVSQFNSAYGAMRCITYDPVRDGFWVVGNWSGDLTLIDRTGAIVQVGPTPQSASDVAYYEDEDNVEHVLVYSQPGGSGNAVVFDYNIATNTLGAAPIFDVYNNLPGVDGGSSGGAFVGDYNGKTAFFANIQQSPNLIGIFELKEGTVTPTPTPTPVVNNCDNLLALPRESCTAWSNECSPCIDKDMEIEVSVNVLLNSADSPEGTTVGFTNLNAIEQAMHPQDMLTLDDSGYHLFDSFRRGTYAIEVRHEGYYTIHDTVNIGFDPNDTRELRYVMTEILYPVRDLYISRTGWAMWERESGWEDGEPTRHFNYYKVMCTSIDGEPIFNKNTEHPFCQVETNELVEGNYYICKVACMFTTGMSAWTEQVFQYEPCDHWGPVDFVNADVNGQGNHLVWQFDHGHNQWIDPNDPDTPVGGEGDSFTESFENGIPANWTTIDADGDGYNWDRTSIIQAGYLINAHTGEDMVSSESWDGIPLTPDNYLVSPQVSIANGSTFSFWACAQDESYAAEHFGVAVSTTGTSAADFTMVQEWTMTAKGQGPKTNNTRNGGTRMGNWYQYTVDLSAYAGQNVYIALRHFNCSDFFMLNADDFELSAPAKGGYVANYQDQPVIRQYADNGIILNFFGIDNVDFRSFLLYNITKNDNFVIVPENEHGQFIVTPREEKGDFAAQFAEFYNSTEADFNLLSKSDILENANLWKSGVNPTYYLSIMMDVFANNSRVENDRCINSQPFCTTDLIEFETANTDQTAEQLEGQDFDDGCIGMSYNPSWYHLRIQTAGPFIIHMEGHDPNNPSTTRDVDFCIWGPFTDPTEPCVDQLTTDKIIDCSYSASYEEDIYLGYPGDQHDHGFGDHGDITYHVPQVGEYYIMMLTNYSRQPCVMSFTKTEGEGETDCDIVVPTNIIGFLITQDGEYLDFVGPEVREYTHVGEFGGHEYCVRPIYPGPAILPDTNYYWCMGCPVCVNTNGGGGGGEEICEPVSNLNGYYLNYNGQEGLVLDWEEPEGATTVRIYADDEYVGDAPASSHPIFLGFDGEVPEHTFVLGVVAVHADCESEMVTVSIYYDDIEENSVACALFPNPTNGNVKIMAKDMRHITVTSVLGQVVYDADVKGDEMDFNMGQFNAGVYMVRIVTEAGIHTQRVTVVR